MIQEVLSLFFSKGDFFLKLTVEHLVISLIAIFIAIILGGVLGVIAGEFPKTTKIIMSIVNFTYTIPAIAMLGLLIPVTGIGNKTAILTLTLYGLLPMIRNTYVGITNIDKSIIEASIGMGSTPLQVLFKIKIPLALPVILAGVRNMVIMTIALAGIAAFIGAGGLGVAIYRGITTNNKAMIVAGSIIIAILAIVIDLILEKVEKKLKVNL